jgi:hypothetical protein
MDNSNDLLKQLQQELAIVKKKKEEKYIELEIKRVIDSIEKEKKKIQKIEDEITAKKYTDDENKEIISKMNGMAIRHIYKKSNDIWTAICDGRYIIHNSVIYNTPSGFAKAHLKEVAKNNRKTFDENGWKTCEVYYLGDWIKLDTFRKNN